MSRNSQLLNAEQIEATGLGQKLLGNVVSWIVKSGLTIKPVVFQSLVKSYGLNERVLRPIRKKTAFIRAIDSLTEVGQGVLAAKKVKVIEDDYRTVYSIYRTVIDPVNESVSLTTESKVTFEKSSGIVKAEGAFAAEILAAYDHFRENYTSEDLREIVKDLIKTHCDHVAYNQNGGSYFTPITSVDQLTKIRNLYAEQFGAKLLLLPIADNRDGKETVSMLAVNEVDAELAELEEKVKSLSGVSSDRSLKSAMADFTEIQTRMMNWNTLVGGFTKEAQKRMETVAAVLQEKILPPKMKID